MKKLADGLRFPEGPVWMKDGSVALVEIASGAITIVGPDGSKRGLATPGGGPNGMAVGPDGQFYVCNNGGFEWIEENGRLRPTVQAHDYSGGRIEIVDPESGTVRRLYDRCGDHRLRGPNDIVFDSLGGFYFTDLGKSRARDRDWGGVYYAKADGSSIVEVAFPVLTANGIGLSPDEKTVYVAETETGRLWAFDLASPGVAVKQPHPSPHGGRLIHGMGGFQRFDSLALDEAGNICVATLVTGAVTVISPSGEVLKQVMFPDRHTTNVCFGGEDRRTAFVTLSGIGELVSIAWEGPAGLRLAHER